MLDLTSVVFGPYASQILADYGADVVKIEAPAGDSTRNTGPAQEPGLAAIFLGLNRNKRSVVLNLKRPAASGAAGAGGRRRRAHAQHAAGQDGGAGPGPRHAVRAQSAAGVRRPVWLWRGRRLRRPAGLRRHHPGSVGLCRLADRQTGTPRYLPTVAADKTCGLVAAHAILAALFQRERTGQGQQLEVPMYESMASYVLVEHYYGRHLADTPGEAGYPWC